MKNCLLVCFVYSALIIDSSREEELQESITVYPRVLEDREGNSEKTLFIHDGYSLELKKASVLAERVLLQYGTNDGVIDRYIDGKHYERHLYHDSKKQAALLVKPQEEGGYHIVGLVNTSHMIEPLSSLERSISGGTPHKLSRLDLLKGSRDMITRTRSSRSVIRWPAQKEKKLKLPENFTIEMVFISDSSHSEKFTSESDHTDYVMVLMLGVSLRLRLLNPPGFIALTSIRRLDNQQDNIYVSLLKEKLVARSTMKKIGNHAKFDHQLYNADAVYLATRRQMTPYETPGMKKPDSLGMAMIGDICGYEKGAVGKDEPFKYSGLSVAVHELGHLMGCYHDGEKTSSSCPAADGYIMNPYDAGTRHSEWSTCSIKAIQQLLQLPTSRCLHEMQNQHVAFLPNDTVKPGTIINGTEYCVKYFRNYEKVSLVQLGYTDNCKFRCKLKNPKKKEHIVRILAPEGTPCDVKRPNAKCEKGTCW